MRKAQPYSSYEDFDFDIPIGTAGDTFDRYIVRIEEMRQSIRIIRQAVEGLTEGPIMAKVPKVIKPPAGEVYVSIEAPKGELGYFLVSDGTRQALSRAGAPAVIHQPASAGEDGKRKSGGRRGGNHRNARYRARRGGPVMKNILGYLHSNVTPGEAGNLFWVAVYVLLVFAGISVGVMFMNWFERKVMAHMQVRLGPMRVGPHGLLQPIADALKLILKEDLMPANADKMVFWFAPVCVVMTAFCGFIVVPFGRTHAITDMNIGVLFMLGVSVARRAGRDHGGLGFQLELFADGQLALRRADGLLRNRHGHGGRLRRDADQHAPPAPEP